MRSLHSDLPSPRDFDDTVSIAKENLRLAVAYGAAHEKLALADVVVQAAVAFTSADEADESEAALENLFDAVKRFRDIVESSVD